MECFGQTIIWHPFSNIVFEQAYFYTLQIQVTWLDFLIKRWGEKITKFYTLLVYKKFSHTYISVIIVMNFIFSFAFKNINIWHTVISINILKLSLVYKYEHIETFFRTFSKCVEYMYANDFFFVAEVIIHFNTLSHS